MASMPEVRQANEWSRATISIVSRFEDTLSETKRETKTKTTTVGVPPYFDTYRH